MNNLPQVRLEDHGLISYKEMWDYQFMLMEQIKADKKQGRDVSNAHRLIFCEHPHVYTLGKSGKEDHILIEESERQSLGLEYFKINRGGDITYHGPGQLVVYPIFDLESLMKDLHKYIRTLEQVIINILSDYGIEAIRMPKYTGVWLPGKVNRKICAIGVHMSRWVSMHGLAFNINTNLDLFKNIIPCGIQESNTDVCSMSSILGQAIEMQEIKNKMIKQFETLFRCECFVDKNTINESYINKESL